MDQTCDVAVIGYGPVGATLVNLLGRLGLRVVVLEREASVHHAPRAASLDAEALRIFQSIGLGDAVAATASVAPGMRFVNADGQLLLHWQRHGLSPEGWPAAYRFHQPTLEAILRAAAARIPNVAVHLATEVARIEGGTEPGAEGATVAWKHRGTGMAGTLRASWVVGCDGARSLVRRATGGALRTLGPQERWVVLDLRIHGAPEGAGPDGAGSVGDSVQHCDPRRPTTYVPLVGRRHRWEFMLMPGDDPATITAPERVWALLRPWGIGPDQAEIERAAVYTFHALVASRWRTGRLLLAGDAAHQMPPFLGQGLCAGLRDAANLAWKLALVAQGRVRGDAGHDLLDSYELERSPHVEAVIALAVRLGRIIQTTDPAQAAERDRTMLRSPETLRVVFPPLSRGLHGSAPAPAGTRAAQPLLEDGTRLDDRVGYHFAVVARPDLLAGVRAETRAAWDRAQSRIVPARGAVARWLDELGCGAAVIRPDRAILAVASTAPELDAASRHIPGARPTGPGGPVPIRAPDQERMQ